MAAHGPAPVPTDIRVLHGRHLERVNHNEAHPRPIPAEPPEWLSPAAAIEWERIAPDVVHMGTAKAVDSAGLSAWCEAVARLQYATRILAETGLMIEGRDEALVKNPAAAMARDASMEMRQWAREFGFTPAARAGIRVVHEVKGDAARLLTDG